MMNLSKLPCLGLCLLTVAGSPCAADASDDDGGPWSFELLPYLWLPTFYDASFNVSGIPASVTPTASTQTDPMSTHITFVAMLAARVHYRDVGLFLDGAWLQLQSDGDTASSRYSGTDIETDIAYGTMALSYRMPEVGKLRSELFAGARRWHFGNTLEFKPGTEPGFTVEDDRGWTDPIIGAGLRYDLSDRWHLLALGDVGGFGVGSDFSWNAWGGLGFEFTDWWSASLGYRYLHVDYESDRWAMDVNIHGFMLGFGFRF